MKKIVLLCMLFGFGFASERFACKSEAYLYAVGEAGAKNIVAVATDFINDGKCKIIYGGKVVHKGLYVYKIRYGEDIWYAVNPDLRK